MNEIYPYSFSSTNLIDFFLICGYEYSYIYNNILNNILEEFENEANQNDNNLFIYVPKFKPSILNSICSFDYQKDMISENNIIDYTFLNIPKIYYNDKNKIDINKYNKNKNIIFYNSSFVSDTKNIYNAYAYKFYEKFSIKNIEVFIPKAFIFISEFPYFKLFKNISEGILIQYQNEKLEIPIEIQLFNILNFLPNSIKNSINFNLFQELNLKNNINNESNLNNFKLNKISGFPFFDIDISEIFKLIPVELLIEVFIFSFLEFKINIFYEHLEYLNLIIYIINSFSYPIETQYNWQVISLSKDDIFDQENSIFDKPIPSIMGFNCNYYDEIENRFLYSGSHFSFDLENKIFEFYSQDKKELDDVKILQIKIKKNLKSNESFFQGIFNILYEKLIKIYNKKFKDNEKFNEEYNFFNSKDNFNFEIQEAFYEFNINFASLFNKFFVHNKENKQININYQLDKKVLNKEEKIFYFYFEVTLKSGVMIELFEQQKIPPFNSLSYLLYYENINLKILNNSFNNYFDLINYFYDNNNKNILNIDFVNFYNYYKDNLKEYFFNESKYSKIINSFKNKDNNSLSLYYYTYNIIELDNNILFKYINLINNLTKEQFNKIFIDYKNDIIFKNKYSKYIDFYYQLEDYFLSKNMINKTELIIIMIFYLIIFFVQKVNLEYFSNIIQQNVFLLKFNINKNIELIFEDYLKLLQKKVKLFTNFSFFSNIIEVLLFHKNNPNINIINLYNQITNYINENNYEFSHENNKFIEKILDTENSEIYNIKLIKANNNEIINEIESYKKTIEDNNESEILYKNEIMINFISNYDNKNININSEIYSIKFLYNEIKLIINEYSLNYDFDKINKKKLNFVLINLIFYIDYIFKFSNKLSKLVYLCLTEEK